MDNQSYFLLGVGERGAFDISVAVCGTARTWVSFLTESSLSVYSNRESKAPFTVPSFGTPGKGVHMGFAFNPDTLKLSIFANNELVSTLSDVPRGVYPVAMLGGKDVKVEICSAKWNYPYPE